MNIAVGMVDLAKMVKPVQKKKKNGGKQARKIFELALPLHKQGLSNSEIARALTERGETTSFNTELKKGNINYALNLGLRNNWEE